jgi:hypothetical protein
MIADKFLHKVFLEEFRKAMGKKAEAGFLVQLCTGFA